jgi:hypothetical protein
MQPTYAGLLYMFSYAILSFFIITRLFIKTRTKSAIARTVILLSFLLAGAIDFTYSSFVGSYDLETIVFINVLFLLSYIRNLREVWIQIAKVVYGSATMFIIVLCFLIFYSLLGYALFSSNKLDESFGDPFSALYTSFGMYTEANYPDVEIPYFIANRSAAIYFWIFLCISVFLLANLLLAVIFNNYTRILN